MKPKTKKPREWWVMVDENGVLYGDGLGSKKDVLWAWNTIEKEKFWIDSQGYSHENKCVPILVREVLKKKRKP